MRQVHPSRWREPRLRLWHARPLLRREVLREVRLRWLRSRPLRASRTRVSAVCLVGALALSGCGANGVTSGDAATGGAAVSAPSAGGTDGARGAGEAGPGEGAGSTGGGTTETQRGLTYPSMWDVPEVPNAAAADVSYYIRYDGVLIDSTFVVPSVTDADAAAWLDATAAGWGVSVPAGKTSIGRPEAAGAVHMQASYQVNDGGSILFRYGHGWSLPMDDDVVAGEQGGLNPITLPTAWTALPRPQGVRYQNAWAQFAWWPEAEGVDWAHPTYFLIFTSDTVDPEVLSEGWRSGVDPSLWIAGGGNGGISVKPTAAADLTGLPAFGP